MAIKIIGVDIRRDWVSAVLIHGGTRGIWLDAHACESLEHPGEAEKALTACIETISGRADISNALCVATLPSERFYYRNVDLPFSDPQKIDQMLPYELEQGLPVSAEDLILDFFPVGDGTSGKKQVSIFGKSFSWISGKSATRILAAAIEKSDLAAYLTCLKNRCLDAETITPAGYPLALCLMHDPASPSNWLLVDAGRHHTALFLVLSRSLAVMRAFPAAGGHPGAEALYPLIRQTLAGLSPENRVDRIFLSGVFPDTSAGPPAADLSEKCGIAVHPVRLLEDIDVDLKSDVPADWDSATGDPVLAAALARMKGLSRLNFRKGDFARRSSWAGCRLGLYRTAAAAGLAALAGLAYVQVDTWGLEKRLAILNRRIDGVLTTTFPDITTIVAPLEQMRAHVQAAAARIPGADPKGHGRLVDLLGRISNRIPEDLPLELNRLVYEDGALQLTGWTDSFNSVETVKVRLEGPNGGFSQVTIVSANLDSAGSRIQFHLNITI